MLNRHEAVLAALDAGVVIHGADTAILEANDRARALLGPLDLEGRVVTDPHWVFLESDESPMPLERFPVMQAMNSGVPMRRLTLIVRGPERPDVWLDVNAYPVCSASGQVEQVVVTFIDTTGRRDVERHVAEQAERLELVLASSQLGLWDWNMVSGMAVFDERWAAIVGYRLADLVPVSIQTWVQLAHPDDLAASDDLIAAHVQGLTDYYDIELRMRHRDGHWVWVHDRGKVVEWTSDGLPLRMTGTHEDISERKSVEAAMLAIRGELESLATRDPLTGLANRSALLDEISRAHSAGVRSGRTMAVLLADLDHFKDINDSLGHGTGDDLLVAAAARIEGVVRAGDMAARLGGDEFVVVMRDLDGPQVAHALAERLVEAFRSPFTFAGGELFATASVGVAIPTDGVGADVVLQQADSAMYAAKSAGRDRVSIFNEDLRSAAAARLAVETDLRHALERGQLAVWYQPEVDLTSGTVIALEALLRWHHPDGEVWTADRFLEIAEDTGLILNIGDWVLTQACTQAATLAADRPDRPIIVRVNLSAHQLAEAGLLAALDEALATSGVNPTLLCAEITETALLRRTSTVAANLAGIRERGVSLALDDFGTKYASLTYLHEFPVDAIKIDRSFMADADTLLHDRRMVEGIVALARILGVAVIAEGVEHPDQATYLRSLGCPSAQGWLFSPALPAEQIAPILNHVYPLA